MSALCRIVIAVTLVVHLMVGCCGHHAHACDAQDCSLPAHSDETHDGHGSGQGADHSHHGPQDCHGAKCSVVATGRAVDSPFMQPFQAFFAVPPNDELLRAGIGREQLALATDRLLLPIRLHLVNQVLLI